MNKLAHGLYNGALLNGARGHRREQWRVQEVVARGDEGDVVLVTGGGGALVLQWIASQFVFVGCSYEVM